MLPALLLTLVLIAVFWALMIRPQQQRQRDHLAMVDALVTGDRVESFSGIHGVLVDVAPTTVQLEIAEGVVVTMARLAVAKKLEPTEPERVDDAPVTADGEPS